MSQSRQSDRIQNDIFISYRHDQGKYDKTGKMVNRLYEILRGFSFKKIFNKKNRKKKLKVFLDDKKIPKDRPLNKYIQENIDNTKDGYFIQVVDNNVLYPKDKQGNPLDISAPYTYKELMAFLGLTKLDDDSHKPNKATIDKYDRILPFPVSPKISHEEYEKWCTNSKHALLGVEADKLLDKLITGGENILFFKNPVYNAATDIIYSYVQAHKERLKDKDWDLDDVKKQIKKQCKRMWIRNILIKMSVPAIALLTVCSYYTYMHIVPSYSNYYYLSYSYGEPYGIDLVSSSAQNLDGYYRIGKKCNGLGLYKSVVSVEYINNSAVQVRPIVSFDNANKIVYEYEGDNKKQPTTAIYYDANDALIYVKDIKYNNAGYQAQYYLSPEKKAKEMASLVLDTSTKSLRSSEEIDDILENISFENVSWDEKGHFNSVEYYTDPGMRNYAINKDGIKGYKYITGEDGLITECRYLYDGISDVNAIYGETVTRDELDRITKITFLDLSYNTKQKMFEGDFCYIKYNYDDNINTRFVDEVEYYDACDQICNNADGYQKEIRDYEDGLVTSIEYFDQTGSSTMNSIGYASKEYTYKDKKIIIENYCDSENNIVDTFFGSNYGQVINEYDQEGRLEKTTYKNNDEETVLSSSGYASVEYGYDDFNRQNNILYKGLVDNRINSIDGYCEKKIEYGEYGRIDRILYIDADNNTGGNNDNEKSITKYLYDDVGRLIKQEDSYSDGSQKGTITEYLYGEREDDRYLIQEIRKTNPDKNNKWTLKKYTYNNGTLEKEAYYDSDAKLVLVDGLWAYKEIIKTKQGISIAYYDQNGKLALQPELYAKVEWRLDGTKVTEVDYYDEDDTLTRPIFFTYNDIKILQYSTIKYNYDAQGNVTECSFWYEDIPVENVYHKMTISYTSDIDKQTKLITFFDTEEKKTKKYMGYYASIEQCNDNNGHIVFIKYFDESMNPTEDSKGNSYIENKYNINGMLCEKKQYNSRGELCVDEKYKYNASGKLIKKTYLVNNEWYVKKYFYSFNNNYIGEALFNEDGIPSQTDFHRKIVKYKDGNCVLINYYDYDGKLITNTEVGYSTIIQKFDNDKMVLKEYRDQAGNLVKPNDQEYARYEALYTENGDLIYKKYYNETGTLITNSEGLAYTRYVYNENNFVIKKIYYGENEEQIEQNGYSMCVNEYDENNNIIRKKYYDKTGAYSNNLNSGASQVEYDYNSDNKTIQTRYYDFENKSINNIDGYALVKRERDDNGLISSNEYFDENNKPCYIDNAYGASKLEYTRDALGKIISISLVDADGNPMEGNEGWRIRKELSHGNETTFSYYDIDGRGKIITDEYNEKGATIITTNLGNNTTQTMYFDLKGKPLIQDDGEYGLLVVEDENYNILKKSLLNEFGSISNGERGYSSICYTYNENGKKTSEEFFGEEGEYAVSNNEKCHKITYEDVPCESETFKSAVRKTVAKYWNVSNELENNSKGFAINEAYYDSNDRYIGTDYLDQKEKPATNEEAGYHIVLITYEGVEKTEKYYDVNMNRCIRKETQSYGMNSEYDSNGNRIRNDFLDENGNLNYNTVNGYARRIETYKDNQKTEILFLDQNEQPIVNPILGYSKLIYEYDEMNRLIKATYYDAELNRINILNGNYSERRIDYNEEGTSRSYYDKDGLPCVNTSLGYSKKEVTTGVKDGIKHTIVSYYDNNGSLTIPNDQDYARNDYSLYDNHLYLTRLVYGNDGAFMTGYKCQYNTNNDVNSFEYVDEKGNRMTNTNEEYDAYLVYYDSKGRIECVSFQKGTENLIDKGMYFYYDDLKRTVIMRDGDIFTYQYYDSEGKKIGEYTNRNTDKTEPVFWLFKNGGLQLYDKNFNSISQNDIEVIDIPNWFDDSRRLSYRLKES